MKLVALTGGFLTGKSTCSNLFMELGAKVLDLDQVYNELLDTNKELQAVLQAELGVVGRVDKPLIKKSLSRDQLSLDRLSSLTHPFIIEELKSRIERMKRAGGDVVNLVEVPLLYECKLESLFDKVIVVACGKSVLEKRAQERNYNKNELASIVDAQFDINEKVSRADIVIDNTGSLDELRAQIEDIYKNI